MADSVPKGPETLGDPTLIEAEELLRRIDEQEKNQTSPDNNIILKAVESSLTKVNEKIAKEQAKTTPNYKDLKRMSKVQTGLMEQKAAIIDRADKTADKKTTKIIEDLTSASDESTVRLDEMKKLQEQKASLEAQLGAEPLKSSDRPADAAKRTEIFGTLSEVTARLEKLEQKGTYEEQEKVRDAQIAKRKEAEAMRAKEDGEAAERIIADLEGSEGESSTEEPDTDQNPEEDKDKPKSTSSEGEEEKAARKKELLHNALHKVAYGLAVDLEKNYPGVDGNAYEKMEWNGKAFLLKIVVMFGGTPKWAELVKDNPTLSEFLEKKVGMTFVQEDVKKDGVVVPGEKRWAVKWDKPVEGWEPGIVEMADVFETAYGDKDKAAKAMEGIKETTTLKEMKDNLPAPAVEEKDKQTELLIKAMEGAGANGETKVQEFLTNTQNAKKVQKFLEPTEETAVAGAPDEEGVEKEHTSPLVSLAEELFPKLDTMETEPGEIRGAFVSRLLVPLSAEDYSYTFDTNTSLTEAYTKAMGSRIQDPEVKADFEAIFTGTLGPDALKNIVDKALIETSDLSEVAVFLIMAVGIGDLSAKDAQSILDDAKDGHIEAANLDKMRVASIKAIGVIGESFKEVSLDTALKEFNPKNDEEQARLEWAKRHIGYSKERATDNLVTSETTFELVVDSASKLKLDAAGIGLGGSKMMDLNGTKLEDFGDAKTVEFKTLPDGTMRLIVTPKGGDPSTSEFKDVDELVERFTAEQKLKLKPKLNLL